METEFTKGDWKINKSPFEVVNIDHKNYLPYEISSDHQVIAAFYELDADTHLMAAAPDMYKMLDEILAFINEDGLTVTDLPAKIREIKPLLAKARGDK